MCYWGTGIHLCKVFIVFGMTVLEVTISCSSKDVLPLRCAWSSSHLHRLTPQIYVNGAHLWGCGNSLGTMLREPGGSWRWNPFRPEADGWAWADRRFHMLSTRTCNILRLLNSSIPSCGIPMLLLPGKMISCQVDRQPGVILAQKQPLRTRRRTTVRPSSYTSNTFPYSQLGFLIGVGCPLATSSHFALWALPQNSIVVICLCNFVDIATVLMKSLDIFWHLITSYDIGDRRWNPFWPLILLAIPLSVCQEFRLIRPWSIQENSLMPPPPRCPAVPGPSSKSSSAAGGVVCRKFCSHGATGWITSLPQATSLKGDGSVENPSKN